MRRRRLVSSVLCSLVALSLVPSGAAGADDGSDHRDSLRAAETAFASTAADRDAERFATFLAPDAVFSGGGPPLRGAEAIVAGWAPFFAPDGPSIEWRPVTVEVTGDGLVGSTQGPYVVRSQGPDGSSRESKGTYFSVWRRASTADPWRIVLDGGVPDPPCGEP